MKQCTSFKLTKIFAGFTYGPHALPGLLHFFLLSGLVSQIFAQAPAPPSPSPAVPAPTNAAPADQPPVSLVELMHRPEAITRLQIFLDQHSFSPGKIDGHWGDFCGKALSRYQLAHGEQASDHLSPEISRELSQISPLYVDYQLTADDFRQVGKAPLRPAEQAKVKSMPYRSILDFVAERYHCNEAYVRKLNSGRNMNKLKPGNTLRVPNVAPFQVENIRPVENLPIDPARSTRTLKVDTRARMLDILDGDKLIGSYPVTPGSKRLPAPIGTWKIVRITLMPWFRWDEEMLNHGKRGSNFHNIPPGPRNPVGIAWIGLNKKGIGIHGTDNPEMIGHSASHGCIRLANWDVNRVANEVTDGMTVEIF